MTLIANWFFALINAMIPDMAGCRSMCEFRIGQKVVCVDADLLDDEQCLSEGAIYTLRWVGIYDHDQDGPFYGVRVVGINRKSTHYFDTPFDAIRFRPLVTDDSRYDISVFQRICSDISTRVSAE